MKLTLANRQNFVNDVMNDMPRPAEKARDAAMKDFVKQCHEKLPADVQKVLKKYPNMFQKQSFGIKGWLVGYDLRENTFRYTNTVYVLTLDNKLPLEPDTSTNKPFIDELNALRELRKRLIEVVGVCNTLEQLKEAFPELIKYMPTEPKKVKRDLPAAGGGVVADLCRLGLPVCDSVEKNVKAES